MPRTVNGTGHMRASKLIDDAAAQRVDPDLVLDYICEPLPVPDQIM